ncbi:helix-turn-helix transcriptional regulator [Hymenobacter sp.]|uniref:helix-turn-helix transcriptional regulator n=1 Tax=Hymenobacter sp. TaxID=1898978 RepID=UPI00286D25F7|nr:helix-turn-helix transcriptional regulator [Hymenobacter sp.]
MVAPPIVPIDQRFAQLIQQFGLTKNAFAMSLGKTASVVQHLIDGRNKPGYDLLCRIFEIYPNVSRDWLLLGRGPMLVGGELTPKPPVLPVVAAPELPLEPIDLTDVAAPSSRRTAPGVAGTRLQPGEIAAALALAAAATQPARAAVAAAADEVLTASAAAASIPEINAPMAPAAPHANGSAAAPAAPAPAAPFPTAEPAAPLSAASAAPVASASTSSISPETFVAAALHAQHLQHQLALAELRNQHLEQQQQMLREMLAMARQAMV